MWLYSRLSYFTLLNSKDIWYFLCYILVTDFLNGHPYSEPSEDSSPSAKRARREPSIVDATEDEQLQAAMQASLDQTKVPPPVVIDSESEDSNDIETFSGSDDEICQTSAKSSPAKSSPAKASLARSSTIKNNTNLAEKQNDSKINNDSEKQKQVVNNINDSLNNISSLSESESSMLDNTGSSDNLCLSEERNYKQYLGQETGEFMLIKIHYMIIRKSFNS